ncbi:hypothetical protein EV179_002538 [Coemansia sp. RSA 487]|nr:hypothetical protein EV179_002538 [Coemansia sp. RSA 487]
MSCPNREGWGPWSKERELDLTPCFEHGVLMPLLNTLLLLFAIRRIRHLQTPLPLPAGYGKGAICCIKLLLAGVVAVTAGLELAHLVNKQGLLDSGNMFTAGQFLQLAALCVSVILLYYEQTRARHSSDILLLYWPIAWMASLVMLRTDWLVGSDHSSGIWNVRCTSVSAIAALFCLELWPRRTSEYMLPENSDNDDELGVDMAKSAPEESANIFSRMSFSWISPLLVLGQHRPIEESDLWKLPTKRAPLSVVEKFDASWQSELDKGQGRASSLLRALFNTHGALFAIAGVFKLFQDLMQFAQPMLLAHLIEFAATYATDRPQPISHGVFYAVVMFVCQIVLTVFLHHYNQLCMVTGINAKSSLIAAIYKKALWLSNEARQENTTGNIITLFSVDIQNISNATNTAHMVWSSPFQIILAIYLLYNTLGWSVFAGVAVMVTAIPINGWLAKRMKMLYVAQMKNKEKRTTLTEEALSGAKVIKLYAWERPFLQRIQHVRESLELVMLRKFGTAYALGGVSVVAIPFLVSFMTFLIYATFDGVSHGPLTAKRVFVPISLFNLLKGPLSLLPSFISTQIEASVSIVRIHKLLNSDELDSDCITRLGSVRKLNPASGSSANDLNEEADVAVHVNNGKFHWSKNGPVILDNVNFSVRSNEHLAVVGRVGSGKSSLVSALLGDMQRKQGEIAIHGQVAYAPQQPWIMNATLRDNILFGLKYDEYFYNRVIDACALRPDLAIYSAGDMIEIGEKGINLSGGQKARVSLARAVYSRADVYILDDPLSAVDAHVGKHLFEHVLGPNGLLNSRCRIHITNAIPYIRKCDSVLLLRDGMQQESGTVSDLMECHGEVYKLVSEYGGNALSNTPDSTPSVAPSISSTSLTAVGVNNGSNQLQSRRPSIDSLPPATSASIQRTGQLQASDTDGPRDVLIAKEVSAVGRVSLSSYTSYLRECTWGGVAVYVVGIIFNQGMLVLSNVWLKIWSSANEAHENGDTRVHLHSITFYMSVYAMLGLCAAVASFVRYNALWEVCVANSARATHNKMLRAVFRSPMSYFDTTPLGRILQRFSKDQNSVDQRIPLSMASWSLNMLNVTLSLTVISVSLPAFSVVIIPVLVLFSYCRNYYLDTSRTLKRLDSTTRSPIYAGFQEMLTGVSTIRAFGKSDRFVAENLRRIDANQRCHYLLGSLDRWLSIRLEWISAFVVFGAALLGVVSLLYGKADAGLVGLAVTYALQSTQQLSYMLRLGCDVENNMCDYVRIQEIEQLPSEAPEVIEDNRPNESWPEQGMVEFKNYSTRYREGLDLVLKDLTFRVMPNQKVGIVGRTGAGKSSLTLALFRIVESAEGKILLDGEDIAQYGLFDVRSKLSIIPQDPVLFAGTVRENLDPFGSYPDQEIWEALQHAHLAEFIRSKDEGLDFVVSQGGDNFSVGQRQLICLARALLKRAKVLVLDEATAAIDNSTDAIIQESIRKEFKNCTVLTIAHRLNTIIDSDMILVLDDGKIAEYDTPQNLLASENGLFKELWAAAIEN